MRSPASICPHAAEGVLVRYLSPVQRADAILGQLEGTALQRTQILKPPTIAPEVMTTVYESLFHDRSFLGVYRRRNEKKDREFVVNPLH